MKGKGSKRKERGEGKRGKAPPFTFLATPLVLIKVRKVVDCVIFRT